MAGKDYKKNLKEVKSKIEKGDTKVENGLRKLLGKPLPKEELFTKYKKLEEYYNEVGNNPTDEPELDFEINEMEKTYFSDLYIDKLKKKKGFNFDGISLDDSKLFATMVAGKVKAYETDGVLKKIPIFDNIDFAKIQKESLKIAKIIKQFDDEITPIKDEANRNLDLMLDGYDPDIDDAYEFENERKKLMKDLERNLKEVRQRQSESIDMELCTILDVKKDDITEWEFNLFKLNALAMIGYNSYTPFSKDEL